MFAIICLLTELVDFGAGSEEDNIY